MISSAYLTQIKRLVVAPAIEDLAAPDATARINLVTGIGLAETGYCALQQWDHGPALGWWQMERDTHNSLWLNYLATGKAGGIYGARMMRMCGVGVERTSQLVSNLRYAAAMTGSFFLALPAPLPDADDAEGMADYHKTYYNTSLGKANSAANVSLFRAAIAA